MTTTPTIADLVDAIRRDIRALFASYIPTTTLAGAQYGNWPPIKTFHITPPEEPDPGHTGTEARRAWLEAIGAIHAAATLASAIPHEGIRAGEITAWRCWWAYGPNLLSLNTLIPWTPHMPMQGNVDIWGVYAAKDKVAAETMAVELGDGSRFMPVVYGSVELWGEIVEHEDGWRAEFAAIRSLDEIYPCAFSEALMILRKRYLDSPL